MTTRVSRDGLYLWQPGWAGTAFICDNPGEPGPELSETLTQYATFSVLKIPRKHSQSSLPDLPVYLLGMILRTQGKQLKQTWRTWGQEPTLPFIGTLIIQDLMRTFVNCWSPVTHASHCMTTRRPAAVTQMRARVNPAMHPKVFSHQMSFQPQHSLCLGLRQAQKWWLHVVRMGFVILWQAVQFC